MFNVILSTDGACSGNPGPGGYAAILNCNGKTKEIAGYEARTTNNRMELRAVIEGLSALKSPCNVMVRTDSNVVCAVIDNLDYAAAHNWCRKSGAKYQNFDLLQKLHQVKTEKGHVINFLKVAGHSGDPDNERCDFLAKQQIKEHV